MVAHIVKLPKKGRVVTLVKAHSGDGYTQQKKTAEHIIEQGGSKSESGMLKLNNIAVAAAYVKSSPEHDAELRGLPRSLLLSIQK